jgi:hypothetical protein
MQATTSAPCKPESKNKLPADAGRMRRLVHRLSSFVAMMAPHQKERQAGEILAEMQSMLGPLQPWQIDIMEVLTDPTRKLCVAHGKMVEAGDDEDGQPRMVIHSTKESLAAVEYLPIYEDALILIYPMNH